MVWQDEYAAEVRAWDRTHRLVGRLSPELLVSQSVEALRSWAPGRDLSNVVLVDVGAGQGLVGIPALHLFAELKVLFVEPDVKKTAFLRHYLFVANPAIGKRAMVSTGRLQDVSRETLKKYESYEFVLFARAFAGPVTLLDSVAASPLAGKNLFVFQSDGSRHFFEKAC